MGILFNQKRQVKIGNRIFDYEELDIYFEIEFSNESDCNVGTIKIYNLKNESINYIKKGLGVEVIGGYGEKLGVLFRGIVDRFVTEVDGSDKLTTVYISSNSKSWNGKMINRSWPPGTMSSTIGKELIEYSDFSLGKMELSEDIRYEKGKTFVCTIKKALEELAIDTKSKLFNSSTAIYLQKDTDNLNKIIDLDSESGLISIGNKEDNLFLIEAFLTPDIEEDCKINIKNSKYNGLYLVKKGKHIGGEGNDFVTKVEVEKCE